MILYILYYLFFWGFGLDGFNVDLVPNDDSLRGSFGVNGLVGILDDNDIICGVDGIDGFNGNDV